MTVLDAIKNQINKGKRKVSSELRENFGVSEAGFGDAGRNVSKFIERGTVNPRHNTGIRTQQPLHRVVFPTVAGVASLAKPVIKAVNPRAGQILQENIDEAKRQDKTFFSIGQNLPTLALPAARIPKIIAGAAPVTRLAGSSLIRGGEAALGQFPVDVANSDVKTAVKNIPRNVAFGAAGNAILSPRLAVKAGKQLASGTFDPSGVVPKGTLRLAQDLPNDPLATEARKYKSAEEFVLPKDITTFNEAKAVGAKRIAPDRIPHQQLTPDLGIKALIEAEKKKISSNSDSWRKASLKIDELVKKYGDKIPDRSAKNVQTIPNLLDDHRLYSDYKKYAPGANSLSSMKQQFIERANRVGSSWTPEQELKAYDSAKKNYVDLIKNDISKGYKYPDEVLNYDPSFKTATDNRARYEKGLHTSFSADDSRIVFDDQNRIVAGMKRQDGKELLPEQKSEIVDGVLQTQRALGIDLNKLSKDERWVYAHLNGKNPFLTNNAAGLYRKGADSVSVSLGGTESFDAFINGEKVRKKVNTTVAHEIGHALDYNQKNTLIDRETFYALKNSFKPVEYGFRGDKYWKSQSEVTARAIEQYVAVKEGITNIFNREGYWSEDIFNTKIKPAIESAVNDRFSQYKTKSQLTDIYNKATKQEVPKQIVNKPTKLGLQKIEPKVEPKSQVKLPSEQSGSIPPTPPKSVSSLSNIPENTPLGKKVNLLDQYLRTPDRVMKKIGLEPEMTALRKSYDNYKAELPQEIEKLRTWQTQVTPEGNQRIFKFLDGQIGAEQLAPAETKVAGEIKDYLKGWADRLGLPEEGRISNYITHIFEKDFIQKEFPDEIANLISDKVAGSVYDPFTQKRLGKLGYVEDTFRALEAYVKRATRKVNLDPSLETISAKSKSMEQSQFKYVKNYIDRVNLRPTDIDSLLDNTIKQVAEYRFGVRPTAQLTRTARQIGYRGGLGLNVGTALKNLSQGANTYAKLGEKYTLTGYANAIKNLATGSDELYRVGVLQDNFIDDRILSVGKQFMQKLDKGLFAMFETAEKINRGAAYFGAKSKGLSQGLSESEAIDYAKKIVRETQFTFGSIDTPPILQSDIGKLVGQFQSFTIKQGEFLGEMAAAKDVAGLIRWSLASLLFVHTVGKAIGMEDKDLIPTFRIGAPPALKLPVDLAKLALGGKDEYGNPLKLGKIIKKDAPILFPGGTQLKKTYEGLKAANQGYSATDSGNVRYPVESTTQNNIKGGLFGQYNFPEARQYFDEKRTPLGDNQSDIFKAGGGAAYYDETIQNRETKKADDNAIKKIESGKASGSSQKISDSLYKLPSGKYLWDKGDGETQKFDTQLEAEQAIKKDTFKKSGKNFLVDADTVYRLSKTGEVTTTTKLEYDYDVNDQKLDVAKNEKDWATWAKLADTNFRNIQLQMNDPTLDELDILKLEKTKDALAKEYQKYKGYGGAFTKPKKGKKGTALKVKRVSFKGPKTKISTVKLPTRARVTKVSTTVSPKRKLVKLPMRKR